MLEAFTSPRHDTGGDGGTGHGTGGHGFGLDSRLFKDRQRLAKMLTQATCAADGCTIPSTWCEAHHCRDPWARGGTTDLDDLQFLCHWHHQRAHDPAYTTERLPNGDVRFARRT